MTDDFDAIPMGLNAFASFQPALGFHLVRRIQKKKTDAGLILPGEAGKDFQPYCELVAVSAGYHHEGSGAFIENTYKVGQFVQLRGSVCMQGHVIQGKDDERPELLYTCPVDAILGVVVPRESA